MVPLMRTYFVCCQIFRRTFTCIKLTVESLGDCGPAVYLGDVQHES